MRTFELILVIALVKLLTLVKFIFVKVHPTVLFWVVVQWLVLHPQFLRNPLYMGGDSHSGITATLLVDKIAKGNIFLFVNQLNNTYICGKPGLFMFQLVKVRI